MAKLPATSALLVCLCLVGPSFEYSESLLQVSALFRHGNRIADKRFFYPNAPYNISMFQPYNYGDLTLEGQETVYQAALGFRQRFDTFLGDCYHTDLADSISSSYLRCQMSLQAIHTAIFGDAKCEPLWSLPWQAVPYSIIPPETDNLISVQFTCPGFVDDVDYAEGSLDEETENVFEILRQYSGLPDPVDYLEAAAIYDYIKTSVDFGFEVPQEFSGIYPQPLRNIALKYYCKISREFKALIGPFVRRVTDVALAKANNTLQPVDRKLFLYAGHDQDILLLLQALNLYATSEEIVYGAYVFFELHYIDGIYGFKLFLQNNYSTPMLLDIPECGTFCPLSWYSELADHLLANRPDCTDN